MGLIKYTTAFIMVALFGIAIITFAVNFAVDNDAGVSIADDSDYGGINVSSRSEIQTF